VADGVVIVLGLHDGYRNARLPGQHIIGEFLLFLVSRRHVATDDDGARGKCDLAANLIQLIPASVFDCRGDEQIADVRFPELFLFFAIHIQEILPILTKVIDYSDLISNQKVSGRNYLTVITRESHHFQNDIIGPAI